MTTALCLALLLMQGGAAQAPPAQNPRQVVGTPRAKPLEGAELDARTKQVASLLRCPVCQGLSVADSPSVTAQNMKAHVRQLLAEGFDQEQILAYFERSYGEFVLLEPARRGVNWLVWIAPVLGLMLGIAIVLSALRSPRAPVAAETGTRPALEQAAGERLPEDPRLAAYVLKVRELARKPS